MKKISTLDLIAILLFMVLLMLSMLFVIEKQKFSDSNENTTEYSAFEATISNN